MLLMQKVAKVAPIVVALITLSLLLVVSVSECQRFKRSSGSSSAKQFGLGNNRIQQQSSSPGNEERRQSLLNSEEAGALSEQVAMQSPSAVGEHVDRLASASGDFYWQPVPIGDWSQQQQLARLLKSSEASGEFPYSGLQHQYQLVGSNSDLSGQFAPQPPQSSSRLMSFGRAHEKRQAALQQQSQYQPVDPQQQFASMDPMVTIGGLRNYHALINDFKSNWSPLTNPSRESRDYKPSIMSTARGFGKRASADPLVRHITYADLLASASPNGPLAINGKMSANAISSKYSDWINQVLSRWPVLNKYVNDKFMDYNG